MRFTIFQDSHIGGRRVNQDRLAYSYGRDVLLMVLADGMGGHARGEIAAEIAISTITKRFQQEAKGILRKPQEFIEAAIHAAHRAIIAFADENDMLECPRTTIVVCIVQNHRAWWAHSGDSRLYVLREGQLVAKTHDHSRVQQLLDSGAITPEMAAVHPDRNKIYNCLGGVLPPIVTHSREWPLKVGDSIILSTDGFWAHIDANYIAAGLQRTDILTLLPSLLIEAEEKAGADADNLSIIGLTWVDQEQEVHSPTVTSTEPIEGFTTSSVNTTQQFAPLKEEVTDEEIERAIAEIQDAIKRVPR